MTNDPSSFTDIAVLSLGSNDTTDNHHIQGLNVQVASTHTPFSGTVEGVYSDAYSLNNAVSGFEAVVGSDTDTATGFSSNVLVGTTGGAGTGTAIGGSFNASSQAGNAVGVYISAGDPSSFTTSGTVDLIKAQALNGGIAGTVIFQVNRAGHVWYRSLPTSSAGLSSGELWNNLGIVSIV